MQRKWKRAPCDSQDSLALEASWSSLLLGEIYWVWSTSPEEHMLEEVPKPTREQVTLGFQGETSSFINFSVLQPKYMLSSAIGFVAKSNLLFEGIFWDLPEQQFKGRSSISLKHKGHAPGSTGHYLSNPEWVSPRSFSEKIFSSLFLTCTVSFMKYGKPKAKTTKVNSF